MTNSIFISELSKKLSDVSLASLKKVGWITDDLIDKVRLDFFELKWTEKQFGDFSSNVVLRLAKLIKRNPKELGVHLQTSWEGLSDIEKVSFVLPGFLNLVVTEQCKTRFLKSFDCSSLGSLLAKEDKKKIILEYVSANPTGPLHIGHGRWAVLGSILANLLRTVGHEVHEEFYINDTGNQIDKLNQSVLAVRENKPVPEDGYHGEYIKDLVEVAEPKATLLAEQKKVLLDLRVEHHQFVSESKVRENDKVKKVIDLLDEKGFIYKKDNAVWFQSTSKGDDKDRVLIRTDGSYTYFAVDIAYHYEKIQRGEVLINILGADHHGYVKRVSAVVDILSDGKVKLYMVIGQLVSLLRGGVPVAFSKRTGNIVELADVMNEIGVDALRYFLSMRNMQSNLEFDLELATQKSLENPVYYIQYANARISSVFKKAHEVTPKLTACKPEDFNFSLIKNEFANEVFKKMIFFETEVLQMTKSYQVHHLNTFVYELATLFHRLYNHEKFVQVETKVEQEKSRHYLYFLSTIQKVFKKSFSWLGIIPMEKM